MMVPSPGSRPWGRWGWLSVHLGLGRAWMALLATYSVRMFPVIPTVT